MREVFVEKRQNLLRIALKENDELVECFAHEDSTSPQIGEIYKARVKNIIPGINSIFLDIGLEKEAYMYYSDELKRRGIKKGEELLVEVLKEPLGNKGAKVSNKVSILGKLMVLTLGDEGITLSKRITQLEHRQNLTTFIKPIRGIGIVFRTEAANATKEELVEELNSLLEKKDALERKLKYSKNIGKIKSNSLIYRFFEELDDKKTKVISDDKYFLDIIQDLVKSKENFEFKFYEDKRTLFDYYCIEKEIIKLRHKKVNLPCGGYIVIDKTEAMYVIDVNSGKNTKARDFNKTIYQTNLEAAKEVGRQIRLRNLSGIIVVDFIDMRDELQKLPVIKTLKKSLEADKGNVKIFPFTELDLVQISRKRTGKSIYEYLEEPCKKCKSNGFLLKLSYIETLISNEIIKCSNENSIKDFYIEIDKNYEDDIKGDLVRFLKNIDGLDKEIYLNFVHDIEGYRVEPLIFSNQKENYQKYKIKTIEKV
ncbi:ribonuclease E/G [Clostridium celatum]|uniref:S1 RNA binding domain protein n=1 Tax=Clostridium celatum DSM 1785 TaxID=545697 RepID=L1Q2R0_9CLOT|nr:ribonuclease E/G [Clostridium celatum]EKY22263.1 S1 RNA binding domain protein [Clostridium celatum DSM 1785]MCE9654614.1 ribonuclease E/G [Clostridium celatum]MDU2265142.1 ribonuclease E/G [Clostridium celatum]MDU6295093.1 ribonuclease E/G [Clostridium celatum]